MANKKHGKKQKVRVVFDPVARKQFLGGFHKRKLERRAKAQEELQQKLKEERQKIKQDAKESYKKMVVSHRGVPEIEHLLEEKHETDTATVRIVELSSNELAKQNNWIGTNVVHYDNPEENEDEGSGAESSETEEVPGMSLEAKKKVKTPSSKAAPLNGKEKKVFRTAKDIKKIIKKESTTAVKKSKAFQLKHKMERIKSLKKSQQKRKLRKKAHEKRDKKKGKNKRAE